VSTSALPGACDLDESSPSTAIDSGVASMANAGVKHKRVSLMQHRQVFWMYEFGS
jgi:hypothetical protein